MALISLRIYKFAGIDIINIRIVRSQLITFMHNFKTCSKGTIVFSLNILRHSIRIDYIYT